MNLIEANKNSNYNINCMGKLRIILISLSFFLISGFSFAQNETSDVERPDMYSDEYFDYLIECTSMKPVKKDDETQEEISQKEDEIIDEIGIFDNDSQDESEIIEPFKLKIENVNVAKYSQSYIKEDTKTIIPITQKFSFTQDVLKFKNNTYVTDDVRALTGAEFSLNKYFKLSSGIETNYRGQEQVPSSQKFYFTPSFEFNDKFSLKFHNKYELRTRETNYDIGLNYSPFKTKSLDLGVYAGLTRSNSGIFSESITFKTSFSFF